MHTKSNGKRAMSKAKCLNVSQCNAHCYVIDTKNCRDAATLPDASVVLIDFICY